MGIGAGSGRGGRRVGAGRKKGTRDALPRIPSVVRADRVQDFRSWARDWTEQNLPIIAKEVMESGTRSEKGALLTFLANHGFGQAPKEPKEAAGNSQVEKLLREIAARRTEEERQKLLTEGRADPPTG